MIKEFVRLFRDIKINWAINHMVNELSKHKDVLDVKADIFTKGRSAEIKVLLKDDKLSVKRDIVKIVHGYRTRFSFYLLMCNRMEWEQLRRGRR
jgi:hypothetical protein